ncbi:unnamed protein product [Calypogeia fissa]
MQTACLLRRAWSQLHSVCRGIVIVRSSCVPPSSVGRAKSQNLVYIVGQRFFSVSSDKTRTASPFRDSGQIALRLDLCRHEYWSAYRSVCHQAGFKIFSSGNSRPTGLGGLLSGFEDDSGRCQDTAISCKSGCGNELASYTLEREEEEKKAVALQAMGMDDDDVLKQLPLVDTKEKNHNDAEGRQQIMPDESDGNGRNLVSRGHFLYPSAAGLPRRVLLGSTLDNATFTPSFHRSYSVIGSPPANSEGTVDSETRDTTAFHYSQRAVFTALGTNFLVFSLKLGVWIMTSSHVMLAEAIHSLADLANQGLIAYGLYSSRRAPDAIHPYGYTKERFVWSLISAVGIFCLGSGATIIHGVQNLWNAEPLENVYLAAFVIAGSTVLEGASLLVAISCVRIGAKAEGMTVKDYLWRGHDPTSVAVMMEDGAAVTGLAIAGLALTAAHYTGNPMWDPIGSIVVGNLLGAVAIFLIQRNRHALLGRSMDEQDMMRVLNLLSKDPVVDAIYDCKSEVIGPGAYRFKAEIDFNGVIIVQNYIRRAGRGTWHKEFKDAVSSPEPGHLDRVMAAYGEEVVSALGGEVDRLEREIQKVVPGIRHVDIEAHNPNGPLPREKLYLPYRSKIN